MKAIAALCALAAVAVALPNPIYREWAEWKAKYQPQYADNAEEEARMRIFAQNKRRALELNKEAGDDPGSARFGLTKFADLTPEEFATRYLREIPKDLPRGPMLPKRYLRGDPPPAEWNWVKQGAVTRVKEQGPCTSGWAFAATGVLEGIYKVEQGVLPELSQQQLLDCDHRCTEYKGKNVCDNGCNGGLMPNALKYAVLNNMVSASVYPYTGRTGTCNYTAGSGNYTFNLLGQINATDQDIMEALYGIGPLSVGVNANAWGLYTGGIFTQRCGTTLNHAALLVGYGQEGNKKYWLLKNSWGTNWGERGFIRLIRGKNKCGVNDLVNCVLKY